VSQSKTHEQAHKPEDLYSSEDREEEQERVDLRFGADEERPEKIVHHGDDEDADGQEDDSFDR